MAGITDTMQHGHRHCDELFADAESAVDNEDWSQAATAWQAFVDDLEDHITNKEEGMLFPALEASGGPSGPTFVMRSEHEQMRALVAQINEALENKDKSGFLGLSETLMILMQQHNMKEEQILYPLMDQFIPQMAEKIG